MNILEAIIDTPNFMLEPINIAHANTLFEQIQDENLYVYIPIEPPKTIEQLRSKYERWSKRKSADGKELWLNYIIFDKVNRFCIGTLQATLTSEGKNYFAYEILPKFWKQGKATETVSYFIDFIFEKFEISQLTAHIDTRNMSSIALVKKLGFKEAEHLINADFFKSSQSDEFVFELSREFWKTNLDQEIKQKHLVNHKFTRCFCIKKT